MSQLGRISGALLNDILNRDGVDLSVETNLLYIDVDNGKIGINQPGNVPSHALDVYGYTKTTDIEITTQATIDNVIFNSSGTISTVTGPLYIIPLNGPGLATPYLNFDRILTSQIEINGNTINTYQTNSNLILDPHGAGYVRIEEPTNITGNLNVNGNVYASGNLSAPENIIVGDNSLDVVIIAPDLTQDIIPGIDLNYDLGSDAGDSSPRQWGDVYITDNLTNTNLILPQRVNVSDQTKLDGNTAEIFALQSNDDLVLNPDTGIVYIERTKWQNNYITNLNNTPITISGTGTGGYIKFVGTNAIAVPAGTSAERYSSPELGMTRWNTDLEILECWDGTAWITSIGAGAIVDVPFMENLGNIYSLILG